MTQRWTARLGTVFEKADDGQMVEYSAHAEAIARVERERDALKRDLALISAAQSESWKLGQSMTERVIERRWHEQNQERIRHLEAANELLRAELAEWNDPDSERRQVLTEEIILSLSEGDRSEMDLRESQLDATEAALSIARTQLATTRERLEAAVKLLRENEWDGVHSRDGTPACMECYALMTIGHLPECRLAAAIRKEES